MIEYKVIDLPVPQELLSMALDPKIREKINPFIEQALNEHAKDGWRLHMSGLTAMPTLVLEREYENKIPKAKRRDSKNMARASKAR